MPKSMTKAEKIVDAIIKDLTDRRGLKHEWWQIEEDIQKEIKVEWMRLASEIIYDNH